MRKFFLLAVLFTTLPAYSQMIDMMGSLGVQGALTHGDIQSVNRGMSGLKRDQILQDLTQTAMEIKTQFMGNYSSVSKGSVFGTPFNGLDWDLSSVSSDLFYIQLNQIDERTCSSLLSSRVPAVRVEVNGQNSSEGCTGSNQMRFIFD